MSEGTHCFHCGSPASKLCDFHIGLVVGGFTRDGAPEANRWRAVMTAGQAEHFYTCDRALCDACAVNKGRIFVCGAEPFLDTYDYCKDHAAIKGEDYDPVMLLPSEAASIRRELHLKLTPPRGKAALVK